MTDFTRVSAPTGGTLSPAQLVDQLRAEHVKVRREMIDRQTGDLWSELRCDVCHVSWPCPTARTIGVADA